MNLDKKLVIMNFYKKFIHENIIFYYYNNFKKNYQKNKF